jgi:hypothetical protein
MQQSPLEILHIGTFKQNEMIYVSKKKIFFRCTNENVYKIYFKHRAKKLINFKM